MANAYIEKVNKARKSGAKSFMHNDNVIWCWSVSRFNKLAKKKKKTHLVQIVKVFDSDSIYI